MGRVEGKVAIITGGAMGLGEAHARRLAEEGACVVITDLNDKDGERVASEIGDKALFVKQDVTSPEDWAAVIEATTEAFGKLDVLVNNAGIVLPGSIEDMAFEDFRKIQSINVDGVFLGCQAAIPAMKKNGGGSLINLSSAAGLKASPALVGYNTSKAAVAMMTKSIALHCGQYNIRCNSVHPGTILTPMVRDYINLAPDPKQAMADMEAQHPIGHIGEPVDIANIVLYLASDESRFATGGAFSVDGGLAL